MSRGKLSYGQDGELVLLLSDGKRIGHTNNSPVGNNGVILLIDCSQSMAGDKIRQAMAGATEFAKSALTRGAVVGVASFGDEATLLVETSANPDEICRAVEEITTGGYTNMAAGITLASIALSEYMPRTIVLVTDGQPNLRGMTDAGEREKALDAARAARLRDIRIICIGVDGADLEFLKLIASAPSLAQKVGCGNGGLQNALAASVDRLRLKG